MQRNLLTEHFNSSTIKSHYTDHQAQALAFLMTCGAKAIVLEEQKQTEELNLQGIINEAELRKNMVKEERIRSIKRRIIGKSALKVWKRGRNEKIRMIDMVLNHDRRLGSYFFSWKSKFNYIKKFELHSNTHVSQLETSIIFSIQQTKSFMVPKPIGIINEMDISAQSAPTMTDDSSTSTVNNGNSKHDSTSKPTKPGVLPRYSSTPFIRLKNHARTLDLSFGSVLELDAFLVVLQKHVGLEVKSEIFSPSSSREPS